MSNLCPACQQELEWDGQYHCAHCDGHYKKIGYCPDCGAELE
ncbi:zinc-ribbon domain-containing protein, partial [Vibrio cholerae]